MFALAIIVVSRCRLRAAPMVYNGGASASRKAARRLREAVSYLAVFSFVFGAVSRVATVVESPCPSPRRPCWTSAGSQHHAGVRGARKKHALSVGDLYDILFPIVAVALIALPFIT
ncbi:MAG: hypothetical protein ACLSVD_03095 [Eggerthellaceae bacterium]